MKTATPGKTWSQGGNMLCVLTDSSYLSRYQAPGDKKAVVTCQEGDADHV